MRFSQLNNTCQVCGQTPCNCTHILESKKKGADGKACWKGYRYNGTENGKDSCVKVSKESLENINGEYDDEAGMAEGSLHTLKRAVDGLMNTIDDNDNLPEWCQEKISLAEDYLVTVWDYIQSEKAQGNDPEINEHKKGVRAMKYTKKTQNLVAKNAPATTVSSAGAHFQGKDQKKKAKHGEHKHKKKTVDMAESNWYELRLNTLLENNIKKAK